MPRYRLKPAAFLAISAFAVFAGTGPAGAYFLTGDNLYASCQSNRQAFLAYVVGAVDKSELDAGMLPGAARKGVMSLLVKPFCQPEGTTMGDIGDIVCRYLDKNPTVRPQPAATLVNQALAAKWPCGQ